MGHLVHAFHQEGLMVQSPARHFDLDSGVLYEVLSAVRVCRRLTTYEPDWHAVEVDFGEGATCPWPVFYMEAEDWPSRDLCEKWEGLRFPPPGDSDQFSDDSDSSAYSNGCRFLRKRGSR